MSLKLINGLNYFDVPAHHAIYIRPESSRIEEYIDEINSYNIKNVIISRHFGFTDENVDFLMNCPAVERLWFATEIKDVRGVYALTNLKTLTMDKLNHEFDVSAFGKLNSLGAIWSKKLVGLEGCFSLKSLTLSKFNPKEKSFCNFPVPPKVQKLVINQTGIVTIDGLGRMPRLEYVDIGYATKLENIAGVLEIKDTLEFLSFFKCKKISDHAVVEGLNKLRVLWFNSCGEIHSLNFLKRIKSLEEFRFVDTNVQDGDMTPLLRLRRVGFDNKKHYTHTNEEVESLIAAK